MNTTQIIGGGEPLLAIDMIEYFCNKLIEKNINVSFIKIFTNGNVSNEANSRLLNIFQTLIKNKKDKVTLGELINGNFADICLSILEDEKTNLGEKYNLFSANKDYVKEYMIYHFGDI